MKSILKKINGILNKKQKIKILIAFFLTILISILETVGIGFLAFFISLIADMNSVIDKIPNFFLKDYLVEKESKDIIAIFLFLIIFFFIFKNILIFLFHFFTNKFKFSIQFDLVQKLLKKYLSQKYNFFLKNEKSKIINYIKEETTRANNVIFGIVNLIKEIILISILCFSILLINFNSSLLIIIPMLFISFLIYNLLKKTLTRIGRQQTLIHNDLFKNIYEIFDGIKLLKLRSLEKKFFFKIKSSYRKFFSIMFITSYIVPIPRLILEVLGVCGLCLIIFLYVSNDYVFTEILPNITFMALAIIRLVPSISALNSSVNTIANHTISIDVIYREIQSENSINFEKISFNNDLVNEKKITQKIENIKIENLSFSYDNSEKKALDNINIEFRNNEIVGIIGKSGSGKSTLTDIISGLLNLDQGRIILNNDIQHNYSNFKNNIGYVPQNNFIFDEDVGENIALLKDGEILDKNKLNSALEVTELGNENLHKRTLGTAGDKISGGQKQRIGISRVFYQNPSLIIFDEATSSIDVEAEKRIMYNINNLKHDKIIIIVAHRLSALNECDKLVIMEKGKIKDFGLKADILSKYNYLQEYIKKN
jgi:ATP-binding cassette, subfamily B, bacterial PglK